MFAGVGGELGSVLKSAATSGGFQKAMKMVFADPAKFMGLLSKMVKKSGGEMGVRFQALKKRFTEAFGPNMAHAMNKMRTGWTKGAAAMSKADKVAGETALNMKALGQAAAKAFKSGLTTGDAYDRMLKGYQSRVMKLSDPAMSKWIKNQQKGFKTFHDKLDEVVKKDGPLGNLTKRLLLVQRVGMSGFFTGLGNLGPMIGNVVTQMGPMLSALSSVGISLMMLGKLLLPGGIIMLGMAMFHKGMREKLVGAVQKTFLYLQENIPKWWPKIKEGLTFMWKKAVEGVKWLMDVVSPMMNALAKAITKVDWGGLVQKVINFVGGFLRGVWHALTGQVSAFSDDSSTLGRFQAAGINLVAAIGKGMLVGAKTVLSNIAAFFFDWSDGFGDGLQKKGATIGGLFVVAMLFGRTRVLFLKGLAWMVATFAAKMLIMTGLSAGVFGAMAVGVAAVGVAIGHGISKVVDYAEKSESVTKGLGRMHQRYANLVKSEASSMAQHQTQAAMQTAQNQSSSAAQASTNISAAAVQAANNQMSASSKASNTMSSQGERTSRFISSEMEGTGQVVVGTYKDIASTSVSSAKTQVSAAEAVNKSWKGAGDAIRKAESRLSALTGQQLGAARAAAPGTYGMGLIAGGTLRSEFVNMVEKLRGPFISALSKIGEGAGEIANDQKTLHQHLKAGVADLVKSGKLSRETLSAMTRQVYRRIFTATRGVTAHRLAVSAMKSIGPMALKRMDPAETKVMYRRYLASATKLLTARGITAAQMERLSKSPGAAAAALGAVAAPGAGPGRRPAAAAAPTVGFAKAKFKPIAGAGVGAGMPGVTPSKAKIIEQRMSEETRRQVGTLSTEVSNLGAAIRALGDIKVVVSGSPAFESFIRVAKMRKSGGGRRLAEKMPGENVGAFATGNS
jgi:hypothetical protein